VLLSLFFWSEATWLGTAVRESVWLFAVLEALHLLGLCVLGGSLLVVDLRMLGAGLARPSIAELADYARPWLLGALALSVATGLPLFLSEAVKLYYIPSFRVKMVALPLALLFTFTVRGRVVRNRTLETSARSRLVAVASIALWLTVAAAGRWIGYS